MTALSLSLLLFLFLSCSLLMNRWRFVRSSVIGMIQPERRTYSLSSRVYISRWICTGCLETSVEWRNDEKHEHSADVEITVYLTFSSRFLRGSFYLVEFDNCETPRIRIFSLFSFSARSRCYFFNVMPIGEISLSLFLETNVVVIYVHDSFSPMSNEKRQTTTLE